MWNRFRRDFNTKQAMARSITDYEHRFYPAFAVEITEVGTTFSVVFEYYEPRASRWQTYAQFQAV